MFDLGRIHRSISTGLCNLGGAQVKTGSIVIGMGGGGKTSLALEDTYEAKSQQADTFVDGA